MCCVCVRVWREGAVLVRGAFSRCAAHRNAPHTLLTPRSHCHTPQKTQGIPKVLHFGLHWDVTHDGGTWEFDKVCRFFLSGRSKPPPSRHHSITDSLLLLTPQNNNKTTKTTSQQHWYTKFDVLGCPPWDLESKRPAAGLFPPPPHPTKLRKTVKICVAVRCFAVLSMFFGVCSFAACHPVHPNHNTTPPTNQPTNKNKHKTTTQTKIT